MTSSGRALDSTWSRRQFLQRTGMGGAALLSAGTMLQLLEACAGPGTTPSTGNVKASWTNVVIPENLDPHIGFDTDTLQFTQNVYEALLEYTPGGLDVRPLLAESYSASSDGLTYTFKIRQGIVFHDGAKLDSQAVLTSFQRLQEINQGPASYLINIGPDNAATAKTLPNVAVVRQPAIQLRTIPLNMIRTPLTDIRVRQALIAAFDYDGYTNFYKGFGRPANSPIPPQFPGWDSSLPYAKQDLAKAKQLLDAAGVKQGTQMRMVTVQGLNYESFAGTIFQSALSKIGIDLKVEAPPWPQIPPQMANNASSPPMTFLNVFP